MSKSLIKPLSHKQSPKIWALLLTASILAIHSYGQDNTCFTTACASVAADEAQFSFESNDKKLNVEYAQIMQSADPHERQSIRIAQRQWLLERDTICEQKRMSYCATGSKGRECERQMETVEATALWWNCKAALTAARTKKLEALRKR